MKFEKLFKIVTEAKNEQPGMRYFAAKNAAGPAGIVSGPIGKSDNFEKAQRIQRWDFDPDADPKTMEGVKGANQAYSSMWKTLNNAFALLKNDPAFETAIMEIANKMDKKRESYHNIIWGENPLFGDLQVKKYDQESKLESLNRNVDKYAGQIEDTKQVITQLERELRYIHMTPSERLNLEREIARLDGDVKATKKYLKSGKNASLYGEYAALDKEQKRLLDIIEKLKQDIKLTTKPKSLDRLKIDLSRAKLDLKTVEQDMAQGKFRNVRNHYETFIANQNKLQTKKENLLYADAGPETIQAKDEKRAEQLEKLGILQDKLKNAREELNSLNDRLNQIGEMNLANNEAAVNQFIKQMVMSAETVKEDIDSELGAYASPSEEGQETVLNPIQWSEVPKSLKEKSAMAAKLAEKSMDNPLIGYLHSVYRRNYGKTEDSGVIFDPNTNTFSPAGIGDEDLVKLKELDSREFDKNTNITAMRDYNSLPFVRLMNVYVNSGKAKMNIKGSNDDVDIIKFTPAWKELNRILDFFPNSGNTLRAKEWEEIWKSPSTKNKLMRLVWDLGVGPYITETITTALNRPWKVTRTGLNNFQQFRETVKSEIKDVLERQKLHSVAYPEAEEDEDLTLDESFDKFYNKVIKSSKYDKDALRIGIMEIFDRK